MVAALSHDGAAALGINFRFFPVNFPVSREIVLETGSRRTASSGSESVANYANVTVLRCSPWIAPIRRDLVGKFVDARHVGLVVD